MSVAEKGRRYRHYKKETMVYTVVDIALDCETVEPLVVYRSEYETPDHPKGSPPSFHSVEDDVGHFTRSRMT